MKTLKEWTLAYVTRPKRPLTHIENIRFCTAGPEVIIQLVSYFDDVTFSVFIAFELLFERAAVRFT